MLDLRLDGRIALVTGGSRGIGRAIALALAEQGAAVAVHYRAQAEAAIELADQITTSGGRALALQGDLSQPHTPDQLVNETVSAFGGLHILVNNAAEMTDSPIAEMPDEMWTQGLEVNLSSVFRACRAAIPHLRAQSWGRIISITSQAAFNGSAQHAHYAASKSGLAGLTYSLVKELGTAAITVNLVAPGRIETDMVMTRSEGRMDEWLKQTPMRRLGTVEEVAAAVVFLASPAASYITGTTLHVNGGMLMS